MYSAAPRPWSNYVESGLWIGAWEARTEVSERRVTDVVSILTDKERHSYGYPKALPDGVVEHSYEIDDAPGADLAPVLQDCLPKIHAIRGRRGVVLVHCAAGVSRSASIAIAYLITHLGYPYYRAYDRLKAARPIIRPNKSFVAQLQTLVPSYVPLLLSEKTVAMPGIVGPKAAKTVIEGAT